MGSSPLLAHSHEPRNCLRAPQVLWRCCPLLCGLLKDLRTARENVTRRPNGRLNTLPIVVPFAGIKEVENIYRNILLKCLEITLLTTLYSTFLIRVKVGCSVEKSGVSANTLCHIVSLGVKLRFSSDLLSVIVFHTVRMGFR